MSLKFPARLSILQRPLLPKPPPPPAPPVRPNAALTAKPSSASGMLPSVRKPLVNLGQPMATLADTTRPMLSVRDLQLAQGAGSGRHLLMSSTSSSTTSAPMQGIQSWGGSATVSEEGVTAEVSADGEFGPLKTRVTNTVAVEKSEPRPTPDGGEQVTLTVEGEVSASVGVEVSPGNWTYGTETTTGAREQYEVTGSPEVIAALEASGQMPDPFHPETIPEGATVLLTSERFQGKGETLGYGMLRTELGYDESEGMAFSAQNLGGGTMRVTAGPTEAVRTEGFLGVEAGPARFGLTSEGEARTSHLVSADFNTNTPEGQRAYQDFLRTGEPPEEHPPHVTNVRTIEQGDSSAVTGMEASLVGFGVSVDGIDKESQTRISTNPATGEQVLEQYIRNGDTAGHVALPRDAQGKPTSEATYTFMIEDVDGEYAGYGVFASTGNPAPGLEGSQNLQLTMTESELMELRDSALLSIGQDMAPPMTDPREIEAWISENPEEPALATADPFIHDIATAESPEDVASAIVRQGAYGEQVTQQLKNIYEDTGIPTPGELTATPSGG